MAGRRYLLTAALLVSAIGSPLAVAQSVPPSPAVPVLPPAPLPVPLARPVPLPPALSPVVLGATRPVRLGGTPPPFAVRTPRTEELELYVNRAGLAKQKALAKQNQIGRTSDVLLMQPVQARTTHPSGGPSLPVLPAPSPSASPPGSAPHSVSPLSVDSSDVQRPRAVPAALQVAHRVSLPAGRSPRLLRRDFAFDGNVEPVVPPDTQLSVGHTAMLQIDNGNVVIWDKLSPSGIKLQAYQLQNTAPSEGPRNGIFDAAPPFTIVDPWIVFDLVNRRWIASALMVDRETGNSAIEVAVSDIDDATTWRVRSTPVTNAVVHDQPKLGISDNKVALAWNDYKAAGGGTDEYTSLGGAWLVLDLNELETSDGSLRGAGRVDPDRCHANPVPSRSMGSSGSIFILATVDPGNPGCNGAAVPPASPDTGNDIWFVRIDGAYPALTVTTTDVRVAEYSAPSDVEQPKSDRTIKAGDSKLLSAIWQNNRLWTTANGSCKLPNGGGQRGCFRIVELAPDEKPILKLDYNVASADRNLLFPALMVDSRDNVFAAVAQVSPERYLGAAVFVQLKYHDDWQLLTFGEGTLPALCPMDNLQARIGDYSGADRDPDQPDKIWAAVQVSNARVGGSDPQHPGEASGPESCAQHSRIGCFVVK